MKRIGRSRKGFTLVEMLIVIAIIVILAGAACFGVAEHIKNANKNAEAVKLHAAGGRFWKIENGKVIELDPNTDEFDPNDPNIYSGGDMDLDFAKVNHIMGDMPPAPQGGGYTPGGSGGSGGNPVDPGTGGGDNPGDNPGGNPGGGSSGGGDNPGGGTVNPVEPEDPMWNGHPESWWDEHDAEIEKKIQEAISKGVNPDDIKVTRDPETGHITNYVIPAAPNNNHTGTTVNNVNLPNGVQTDDHKAGAYEIKDLGGGKTQVGLQTNAWYRQNVTIEKQGNKYVLHVSGNNRYVLQGANHEYQNIWPNLDKDNQTYTLNKDQIECLKSFGINLI